MIHPTTLSLPPGDTPHTHTHLRTHRYLVEAPPNVCTPQHLAAAAAEVTAKAPGHFTLEVLDAGACAALGMGCYLGVAEASLEPPAFIHLTYKPTGEAKKKVGGGAG